MQRTTAEGRGPVRFGPPPPEPGLPVLPELVAVLAAAAGRSAPEPPGGGEAVREAACRHWGRRGLTTAPENVAAGPGAPALLLALLGAYGGDVMLPRPCPAWWTPQVRLLGRRAYHVPPPAECGGIPDPYALLETVRRVRAEGGDPRVLLLSVADDPTATVPPPEILREACEAAESAGLFVVSDESWRDTVHRPHDTLVLSPAEMLPDRAAVLVDLSGALLPAGWPAAVVRFPDTPAGPGCAPAPSTSSPPPARSSPAPSPGPPRTPSTNPTASPHGPTRPPPCTARSPPPRTGNSSPSGRWPGPRRPDGTSTPT